jgi:hypothetical protein
MRVRQSVRLEERYGGTGCKVDDRSINPQGILSRTFVTHWTTSSIHPRTRARSSSNSRPASPRPIVLIANAWFRRKVCQVWADGSAVACNGTLWLARQRIQVAGARHGSGARPIRNSLGSSGAPFRYRCKTIAWFRRATSSAILRSTPHHKGPLYKGLFAPSPITEPDSLAALHLPS